MATFQSQARSQSPSDPLQRQPVPEPTPSFNLKREASPLATFSDLARDFPHSCFNLKREASPLATSDAISGKFIISYVSISSEKPVP